MSQYEEREDSIREAQDLRDIADSLSEVRMHGSAHDLRVIADRMDALVREAAALRQQLDAAMQYVPPKDRDWIESLGGSR